MQRVGIDDGEEVGDAQREDRVRPDEREATAEQHLLELRDVHVVDAAEVEEHPVAQGGVACGVVEEAEGLDDRGELGGGGGGEGEEEALDDGDDGAAKGEGGEGGKEAGVDEGVQRLHDEGEVGVGVFDEEPRED